MRPAERWWSSTADRAPPLETRRNHMSKSVAIVTGASQGIGHSTAIRLARDFSSVVLAARDRPNLEKAAGAGKAARAEPLVLHIDPSEGSAAEKIVYPKPP